MKIPFPEAANPIGEMASELKNCKNEDARKTIASEIDREIYKQYGLNKKQIEIVESNV
ncbi:MAG: hypothetical protein PHC45_09560 [Clostridiaceae bacterium]|nr:hypothetical protein [Clostridiaceae bacterium]